MYEKKKRRKSHLIRWFARPQANIERVVSFISYNITKSVFKASRKTNASLVITWNRCVVCDGQHTIGRLQEQNEIRIQNESEYNTIQILTKQQQQSKFS